MTDTDPISQFLTAIETATIADCPAIAPDMTFDATVPEWRFQVEGAPKIREELSRWYATPGAFEEVSRTAIPGGEVVQFLLRWVEDGVDFAVHQAHVLEVAGDRIVRDTTWCGGRWSATLQAEMAHAAQP
ncbi:MAG: hypothetical protein ACRDZ8_16950 [Acidimicrobiales bacterium]